MGILEHGHTTGLRVQHVGSDVEGVDTTFRCRMQVNQVLKFVDDPMKEVVAILLRRRSFLFSIDQGRLNGCCTQA